MSISIRGIDEVVEAISKPLSNENINDILTKACLLVERSAKQKAPKGDGDLRRSITHKVEGNEGVVYTPLEYAPYVEYACESVLPTHYELELASGAKTPCISWQERNNYVSAIGDTRGYSVISFTLKIWGNDIAEIMDHAAELDKAMRAIGFQRVSSNELYDRQSTMIQKIMTYEALCLEDY